MTSSVTYPGAGGAGWPTGHPHTPRQGGAPDPGPHPSSGWRAGLAELLAQLAIGLVHVGPAEVERGLDEALAAVAGHIGADRASMYYHQTIDGEHVPASLQWHAAGVPISQRLRQAENDPDHWLMPALSRGEAVEFSCDAFPIDDPHRAQFEAEGVRAALALPMRASGRLVGAVLFETLTGPGWPAGAGDLLVPFGDLGGRVVAAQRTVAGLAAGELRYRSVLDEIGDVIIRVATDGRLTYANRAWQEVTGHPVEHAIGTDPLNHVHPDDRDLVMAQIAAAFDGRPGVREIRVLADGGGLRWMEVQGRAVFADDGRPAGFAGVLRDVTRRKEAEARVQAAREEAERARDDAVRARDEAEDAREAAERASRAKSEFLSRMSHELRTPLNAILGFSQLLEFAGLDGEDADNLALIGRAGRHLLGLIDDTLDVSRIESGRLSLSLEPVSVIGALRESLDLVRPAAAGRRVELHLPPDRPAAYVRADSQRLRQVLVNLLSNAVKYNRPGGNVRVDWAQPAAADTGLPALDALPPAPNAQGGWLRIEVTDTGCGIPADRLNEVFMPFERLGAELTEIEGTGIGLTLTRSLVEAMGGRIGVRSTAGVGSTFHVELPLTGPAGLTAGVPADIQRQSVPPGAHTHTVLYIEDNPSNITLMRRILARRPYARILVATDGNSGLAMVREHRPDLVLLDLHLPARHGGEVLAEIRVDADPALAATPVVIVTADLAPGTERRLTEAGASAFLPKPVDLGRLLTVVDRHLLPRVAATHQGE